MSETAPPSLEDLLDDDDEEPEMQARDLWALYRFLKPYTATYRKPLFLLALTLILETIWNFSFPIASQYLVDRGLGGEEGSEKDFGVVIGVIIFLGVGSVAITVLGLAMDYLNAKIFAGIVVDIRQKLFGHVQGLSMPFFTQTRAGEVLSRFSGDLVALEGTLLTMVPWALVPLLEVIYSVIVMIYFNVWLGLLSCLVFPMVLWLPRIFAAWSFALSYDKRKREAELLGAVQENVTAQAVVKAFGMQPPAISGFLNLNQLWQWVAFRVHFLGQLVERSANSGVYLLHVLIFGLGAYWVYTGKVTLG
ncbi:MAG TPA: ABC transporter ATP-binding protein, partial [Gemmataceae bacterium]|nr:ABC transporter ATP-binding protein [Gemmataceae bacterium]